MARQRIPLVGSPINRNENQTLGSTTLYDQRFTNCFPETTKNPITGSGKLVLVKRAGWGSGGATDAGASYYATTGGCTWSGYSTGPRAVFCFINGTTLKVMSWNSTASIVGATISNITAGLQYLSETLVSNGGALGSHLTLVAKKSTDSLPHAWYLREGDASWTEITDVDFPANIPVTPLTLRGGMVHMDGYAFVMDSIGQIWNSDLNSLSAWTSTSFINTSIVPDGGVGLARTKNLVVAFGTSSIEFFQNAGNATGSPLQRISSATIRIGALFISGYETIKQVGDDIYFIGVPSDSGAPGVYVINGTSVKKISNAAIDKRIYAEALNVGIAGVVGIFGQKHLFLTVSASHMATYGTPVYCLDTGLWWYYIDSGAPIATGGNVYNSCATLNSADSYAERVWFPTDYDQGYGQASGTALTMSVQTVAIDHGTDNLKECTAFRLIADTQTVSGNASVSYSDNDYVSFSTAKTIDMTQKQKKLDVGLGWFRSRAWKIVETINRPFRGEAFEVEWEESEE